MAHEVENMFSVNEKPWHGLGTIVKTAPTIGEAIKLAGLDWRVLEQPIYTFNQPENKLILGQYEQVDGSKALLRSDNNTVLGIVSNRYQPLQNVEAFNFYEPLVTAGLVELETAGCLREGKRIWVMAKIAGDDIKIIGDDVIRKYILLSNSHDGTMAVRVGFTPVRVVCANTLAMAHRNEGSQLIRLRHAKGVTSNLDALREVINLANYSFTASAEQYAKLAQRQINSADLRSYVKICLGYDKTEDKDLSTRAENQIDNVIRLFSYGKGQDLTGVKGTVWAAYNAVTEHLSHEVGTNADSRMNSLWFGANAQKNELALSEALKLAA
jgi:phage/plasmid-like protein (TIGR03299 family)